MNDLFNKTITVKDENESVDGVLIGMEILDCILAMVNPKVVDKSDTYFTSVESKERLYKFFTTEGQGKGWYADDFIDMVFGKTKENNWNVKNFT